MPAWRLDVRFGSWRRLRSWQATVVSLVPGTYRRTRLCAARARHLDCPEPCRSRLRRVSPRRIGRCRAALSNSVYARGRAIAGRHRMVAVVRAVCVRHRAGHTGYATIASAARAAAPEAAASARTWKHGWPLDHMGAAAPSDIRVPLRPAGVSSRLREIHLGGDPEGTVLGRLLHRCGEPLLLGRWRQVDNELAVPSAARLGRPSVFANNHRDSMTTPPGASGRYWSAKAKQGVYRPPTARTSRLGRCCRSRRLATSVWAARQGAIW